MLFQYTYMVWAVLQELERDCGIESRNAATITREALFFKAADQELLSTKSGISLSKCRCPQGRCQFITSGLLSSQQREMYTSVHGLGILRWNIWDSKNELHSKMSLSKCSERSLAQPAPVQNLQTHKVQWAESYLACAQPSFFLLQALSLLSPQRPSVEGLQLPRSFIFCSGILQGFLLPLLHRGETHGRVAWIEEVLLKKWPNCWATQTLSCSCSLACNRQTVSQHQVGSSSCCMIVKFKLQIQECLWHTYNEIATF